MRNGKKTLFPSWGLELDLCQLRVGRTSPLYPPNHLSFKGMFMFSHFSPPIVLKETEPMRSMLQKFLCALQCTWWCSLRAAELKVQASGGCVGVKNAKKVTVLQVP